MRTDNLKTIQSFLFEIFGSTAIVEISICFGQASFHSQHFMLGWV